MVNVITYIKRLNKWLFNKKEMDVSYLILFSIFFLLIQITSERKFVHWYYDIIYIIIKVTIGVFILKICDRFLEKLLGKYNKPVKFRYYALVLFVLCIISSFINY